MDKDTRTRTPATGRPRNKVALINPRRGWRPGLGLLYVASALLDAGYEVRVFEFFDENFDDSRNHALWKSLFAYDADIYGFGVISWNRAVTAQQIARIRQHTSGKFIICGGKDPSYMASKYLEYGADAVVVGEGETTMVETADAVNAGSPLDHIKGLVHMREGELVENAPREPTCLDKLLFPALHLVDYAQYTDIKLGGIPGHYIRTGFMMANRGCPFNCKFCAEKVRNIYRERPLDDIVDEIRWQRRHWNIKGMVFLDDLFYHKEERIVALCHKLNEAGLDGLAYYAQTRVDRTPSRETLALMRRTGFIQLALGVESGSPRILEIVNKGTTIEMAREAVARINAADICSYAYMIVGLPEETVDDLDMTAEFLESIKPTFVAVNYYMPMPGTRYFNEEDDALIDTLSYSLTENQTYRSALSQKTLAHYRALFESKAQRSANMNLFRYVGFYGFLLKMATIRMDVLLKGAWLQMKTNKYSSYFEAVRTAMINYKITG